MQRCVRVLCAVLVPLAFASCGGKQSAQPPAQQTARATNTYPGLTAWSFTEEGKLSSAIGSLNMGDALDMLPEEPRVAPQSGADRTFMKIRTETGLEGWVRMDLVIKDAVPGVVVAEEATIYSAASNTSATVDRLARMALLAVHEPKAGDKFVEITAWDATRGRFYPERFLRAETVSTNGPDVKSAVQLFLALNAKDAGQREELLAVAQKDYPGSVFAKDVSLALSMLRGEAVSVTTIMLSPDVMLETTAEQLSVRSAPDSTWAVVETTLARGQRVRALERTTEEFVIDGVKGPWYHLSDPDGWIFGGYVKETPMSEDSTQGE